MLHVATIAEPGRRSACTQPLLTLSSLGTAARTAAGRMRQATLAKRCALRVRERERLRAIATDHFNHFFLGPLFVIGVFGADFALLPPFFDISNSLLVRGFRWLR
jgi:hypothetical protein